MEQKDLFPQSINKETEYGSPLFYRVRFYNPFEPKEPMEVEVVVYDKDDPTAAIFKARQKGNFPEDQFEVESVEKFDPLSEEEHRRSLAQALPRIFKNEKK